MCLNILFAEIGLPSSIPISIFFAETCPPQNVSNGEVTYNSDPVNGRYLIAGSFRVSLFIDLGFP